MVNNVFIENKARIRCGVEWVWKNIRSNVSNRNKASKILRLFIFCFESFQISYAP